MLVYFREMIYSWRIIVQNWKSFLRGTPRTIMKWTCILWNWINFWVMKTAKLSPTYLKVLETSRLIIIIQTSADCHYGWIVECMQQDAASSLFLTDSNQTTNYASHCNFITKSFWRPFVKFAQSNWFMKTAGITEWWF